MAWPAHRTVFVKSRRVERRPSCQNCMLHKIACSVACSSNLANNCMCMQFLMHAIVLIWVSFNSSGLQESCPAIRQLYIQWLWTILLTLILMFSWKYSLYNGQPLYNKIFQKNQENGGENASSMTLAIVNSETCVETFLSMESVKRNIVKVISVKNPAHGGGRQFSHYAQFSKIVKSIYPYP